MNGTNFGKLLSEKRLNMNLTIREFARLTSYDASNISKIERGIIPPPPTMTLKKWAERLSLQHDTSEHQEFLDTAVLSRNQIPEDAPAEFRNQLLPALLRTSRSKKLTKKEFDSLVRLLNRE